MYVWIFYKLYRLIENLIKDVYKIFRFIFIDYILINKKLFGFKIMLVYYLR